MTRFYSEALGRHDRSVFTSGHPRIDQYFRQTVTQDVKRRLARCFVLVEQTTGRVAGMYTLTACSIPLTDLPEDRVKKLPRYPTVPAGLIGWLGRSEEFRGQGVGRLLLGDALTRLISAPVGIYAVCADAIDEKAARFYREHQFEPFASRAGSFFLPIATAQSLFAG